MRKISFWTTENRDEEWGAAVGLPAMQVPGKEPQVIPSFGEEDLSFILGSLLVTNLRLGCHVDVEIHGP